MDALQFAMAILCQIIQVGSFIKDSIRISMHNVINQKIKFSKSSAAHCLMISSVSNCKYVYDPDKTLNYQHHRTVGIMGGLTTKTKITQKCT